MDDTHLRTGFVVLSDYYPYQHQRVLEMLFTLDAPFVIVFHAYGRYAPGCFRAYVPEEYVQVLRPFSMSL